LRLRLFFFRLFWFFWFFFSKWFYFNFFNFFFLFFNNAMFFFSFLSSLNQIFNITTAVINNFHSFNISCWMSCANHCCVKFHLWLERVIIFFTNREFLIFWRTLTWKFWLWFFFCVRIFDYSFIVLYNFRLLLLLYFNMISFRFILSIKLCFRFWFSWFCKVLNKLTIKISE